MPRKFKQSGCTYILTKLRIWYIHGSVQFMSCCTLEKSSMRWTSIRTYIRLYQYLYNVRMYVRTCNLTPLYFVFLAFTDTGLSGDDVTALLCCWFSNSVDLASPQDLLHHQALYHQGLHPGGALHWCPCGSLPRRGTLKSPPVPETVLLHWLPCHQWGQKVSLSQGGGGGRLGLSHYQCLHITS